MWLFSHAIMRIWTINHDAKTKEVSDQRYPFNWEDKAKVGISPALGQWDDPGNLGSFSGRSIKIIQLENLGTSISYINCFRIWMLLWSNWRKSGGPPFLPLSNKQLSGIVIQPGVRTVIILEFFRQHVDFPPLTSVLGMISAMNEVGQNLCLETTRSPPLRNG